MLKRLFQAVTGSSSSLPVANAQTEDTAATPREASSKGASGFAELGLAEPICRAVAAEGYTSPTPIQAAAIPYVIAGRDLLGCAQTGTGKTAAFALPILHRLVQKPTMARGTKVLILTPTRELALQIGTSFKTYGAFLKLKTAVVFGGVGLEPQKQALRSGVDILVATPGRLLDLYGQGVVDYKNLEILVLDEADRMLDMGFIHDVKKILSHLPKARQNLLFSATMPRDIAELSRTLLRDPAKVEVTPVSSTSDQVTQFVYHVAKNDKKDLLLQLLTTAKVRRALVFTRTKRNANRVAEFLCKANIPAEAIHGNKSQSARQRALENFRSGKTPVLVASDLAARGLDIDEISHVINFELPNVPETYVHRIGRTGRAMAIGEAHSFCDAEERDYLRTIERVIGRSITVNKDHPFHTEVPARQPERAAQRPSQQRRPDERSQRRRRPPRRRSKPAGGAV